MVLLCLLPVTVWFRNFSTHVVLSLLRRVTSDSRGTNPCIRVPNQGLSFVSSVLLGEFMFFGLSFCLWILGAKMPPKVVMRIKWSSTHKPFTVLTHSGCFLKISHSIFRLDQIILDPFCDISGIQPTPYQ